MNELSTIQEYRKFKEALGTELRNQAEGFVRTGYLLKRARDTDILKDSGYASVAEFALAEYGLSKDIVSRYIAINDRYSKDGYSEFLEEKYEGYGVAKLQEMLVLPDTIVEMITPEVSKREIQELKKEIKEEEKITDIEVLLERQETDTENMDLIQRIIFQYFRDNKDQFEELKEVIEGSADEKKVNGVLAPSGISVKTVRIPGIGKLVLSFGDISTDIKAVNVRSNEKETFSWQEFTQNIISTFAGITNWKAIYGEVAPVQPKNEPKAEENESGEKTEESVIKTPENVTKVPESATETPENHQPQEAAGEPDKEVKVSEQEQTIEEETVENPVSAECEVIPGQAEIEEYPEALPEKEGESDEERTVRGYKAAVTSNLRKLNHIWESEDEGKVELMLKELKDLEWRLNKIKELEG